VSVRRDSVASPVSAYDVGTVLRRTRSGNRYNRFKLTVLEDIPRRRRPDAFQLLLASESTNGFCRIWRVGNPTYPRDGFRRIELDVGLEDRGPA